PPDRPAQSRRRRAEGPSQRNGSCVRPRRSPPVPHQNPPARDRDRSLPRKLKRDSSSASTRQDDKSRSTNDLLSAVGIGNTTDEACFQEGASGQFRPFCFRASAG